MDQEDAKPVHTPVETAWYKAHESSKDYNGVDQKLYLSAMGSLFYLSIGTRLDIAYAVSNIAKFCAKPAKPHQIAVKCTCIMRYLKGTVNLGRLYRKDKTREGIGYSEADSAGDVDDRKSTSCYLSTKQMSAGGARNRHV